MVKIVRHLPAGRLAEHPEHRRGAMPRFVTLSFLILAWAFYELSGGADFVPRGVRPPRPEPQADATRDTASQRAKATLAPGPVIAPRRTRPETEPIMTAQARQAARQQQLRSGLGRSMGQGIDAGLDQAPRFTTAGATAGLGGGLELASLSQGAAGLHEAAPEPQDDPTPAIAAPAPDIRQVTGLRVNMRDGPGTIYPVIARLQIGDEVEVLGDSGTGWLRLRILPGHQAGWIAASLISKKAP